MSGPQQDAIDYSIHVLTLLFSFDRVIWKYVTTKQKDLIDCCATFCLAFIFLEGGVQSLFQY